MAVSVGTAKASVSNFRWEPRRRRFSTVGGNREGVAFAPKSRHLIYPSHKNLPEHGQILCGGIGGI
jgi:uncharacterized protein with WD repeat